MKSRVLMFAVLATLFLTAGAVTRASATTYSISVKTTGLSGTLVVADDAGDDLTFTTNTTQTFANTYASGATYSVTVKTQPTTQTCTLSSNATGTITKNITVTATCKNNYTISVAVTGLTGTLIVKDNKSVDLTFTTNDTQTFSNVYTSGSTYTVSVKTQPSKQSCTLSSNASGTITSNITVTATCVPTYTISVKVTGLTGTLVVEDSLASSLTFTTNTTKAFSKAYASGSAYTVTVETQPAGQTCTLGSNASGTITSNITVDATCASSGNTLSVAVSGLSGTVVFQDDQGATLTFTSNNTQTFSNTYANAATYTVSVTSQPTDQACIPTYSTATINSNTTIEATCATGATRALGTVSDATSIACQGSIKNGVCQQVTVSCPGLPDVYAYVKTNTPTGTSVGTTLWMTGTNGTDLYDSIFNYGSNAVQDVLNANFTTVQISWGAPFNTAQTNGWVSGPGGVLESACRVATLNQWIYTTIQNNTKLPMCATGNSGGAGAIAYALNQYNGTSNLSMVEMTSGPPTARLDWGCGCTEGKVAVACGSSPTLGTCFGAVDGGIWDPAYNPNSPSGDGVCTAAVAGTLPPGGLNFFLGDSANASGAVWNFSNTYVNAIFGGLDNSAGVPIGYEWLGNVTSSKTPAATCMSQDGHTIPDYLDGATQIANDLISLCKIQ
ncbi:MAG: hypothetical protein ACLQLC_20020 [Candidatus Sulfotelmatobacter sp.]